MDVVSSFATSVAAMALGHTVGFAADTLASKVEFHRKAVGGEPDKVDESLFDDIVTLSVHVAFLIAGISIVQRVIPSTTTDLRTLFLFQIGIQTSIVGLPTALASIRSKLTKAKSS